MLGTKLLNATSNIRRKDDPMLINRPRLNTMPSLSEKGDGSTKLKHMTTNRLTSGRPTNVSWEGVP